MARILWISPVGTDAYDAPIGEELRAEAAPGTRVDVCSLPGVGPQHLEWNALEAVVAGPTMGVIRWAGGQGTYDAAVIGCFYDPFLRGARELSGPMAVTAPAEACLHTAATVGERISILVGRKKWIPEMHEKYGITVAWVRINSFIATLATSFVFYGIGFLLSDRSIIRVSDRSFSDLARGRTLGVTNATWIAAVVVVLFWLVLERTRFGRHVFAAGGNPEAARMAGVRIEGIVAATFVITGAAAGLAGALSASRTLTAQPSDDFSFVFAVLTAVIVGGTSIAGGEGAVWRTVFGAFFTAFMLNGFNLHQIDPIIQRLIQGSVILVAVAADNWTRRRRSA